MEKVDAVSFEEARNAVVREVAAAAPALSVEQVPLVEAAGRILARDIPADRDYPSLDRSIRDGYAVRSCDLPGRLQVVGEVRAGEFWTGSPLGAREAIRIMTGAPMPPGADAVVMVEHTTRSGDGVEAPAAPVGQFINRRGSESTSGAILLKAGQRIGFSTVAVLAAVGCVEVPVYGKPTVAILSTGDEIVDIRQAPEPHQIRNSNAYALAVQVAEAGGLPRILPVAEDTLESTRRLIEMGLQADLLLTSGGVSAGEYDLVETVLGEFGAQFYFDRVRIQPGQPLVFGKAQGRFFFGLPGNPNSTMVTFHVFARVAVELLAGLQHPALPMLSARITVPYRHKPGLTRFLPASLSADGAELTPVRTQGSSDVIAMARANCLMVVEADRESWQAGDWMRVLMK